MDYILARRHKRFVIFAGPSQHAGMGRHYISKEGIPTTLRSDAARFYSSASALYFARLCNLARIGTFCIGEEEFNEVELQAQAVRGRP